MLQRGFTLLGSTVAFYDAVSPISPQAAGGVLLAPSDQAFTNFLADANMSLALYGLGLPFMTKFMTSALQVCVRPLM